MYFGGVARTPLDDVRYAAGVGKSQIYHCFSDKAGLMQAVIRQQTDRVILRKASTRGRSIAGRRGRSGAIGWSRRITPRAAREDARWGASRASLWGFHGHWITLGVPATT